jgi:hypothetical protein
MIDEPTNEFSYRLHEALGILCGDGEPTPEQWRIATDEARRACQQIADSEAADEFFKLKEKL